MFFVVVLVKQHHYTRKFCLYRTDPGTKECESKPIQKNLQNCRIPQIYTQNLLCCLVDKQEAQLPQRNSVSAVHVYLGWLTDRAMHRTQQNRRACTISDIQTL